jgi:hypothetical protein
MHNLLATMLIGFALLQSQSVQPATTNPSGGRDQSLSQKGIDRIVKEVRHELVLLPLHGVFESLGYRVSPDGTVKALSLRLFSAAAPWGQSPTTRWRRPMTL